MEIILSYLHSGFSAIFPFIVLLGLLIFVHELGHFAVAKYFKVRVEVFSLGFGKKLLKWKKGDTTYCISMIPLGGYVKMFGDEVGAKIAPEDKPFSFLDKPVAQRIAVVLAGPLMNFFFAILIFMLVSLMGEEVRAPKVGDVPTESVAALSGFRSGDEILSVNGQKIKTWDEFQNAISEGHQQNINLEVRRENSDQILPIIANPKLVPNPNILSLNDMAGDIEGLTNTSRAAVVGVKFSSIAYNAGLRTGDLIKSINGNSVKYFRELENFFISSQGQKIQLKVERENKPLDIEMAKAAISSIAVLGIEDSDLYLYKVIEDSPALKAGLKSGDRIVKVGPIAPKKWEDVLTFVKSYSGSGHIAIDVDREGKIFSFQVMPKMTAQMNAQGGEEKRFTVGIYPWIMLASPETTVIKSENPVAALKRGFKKTIDITSMTIVSFLRLIQNKISPKNIGGVISIGQAASETFKVGISHFLQMMAIISVNLFILNLLPIPVLDGGHLLFYTIEALRGAPVSMRKMEVAQQVGLVVLMSLMVFALFNDFSRLLSSW